MKLQWLVMLSFFLATCSNQEAPAGSGNQTTDDSARAYASLAQVMRGLLYPNSEIIFATQSEDPEEAAVAAEAAASAGQPG